MLRSYNPELPARVARFGLVRVRSPLLAESWLFSFPPGTEMVHFPGFAPPAYGFSRQRREWTPARFPHSDIPGSTLAYSSPRLFAVSHVLHRLLSPRHPPYALSSLPVKPTRTGTAPAARARRARRGRPGRRYSDSVRNARRSGTLPAIAYDLRYSVLKEPAAPPRGGTRMLVGVAGFEPATSSLSGMRSNQLSYTPRRAPSAHGGADRSRTDDLLNANQALSQLSYSPGCGHSPILRLVGRGPRATPAACQYAG